GARRRHSIGHHGWGIVNGLELTETTEGLVVQPGIAVDGYGRELIVSEPLEVSIAALAQFKTGVDVWLVYDLVPANIPQRGRWGCGPGSNTRVRERSSILITALREVDPRFPDE